MLDEVSVFLRGLMIGVMVAAPVGPVGLLCIRRTLQKGLTIGFASGFGAAFADAFFSLVAALGVTAVIEVINTYQDAIYVLGGLFLLFIAYHTWHDKPRQADTKDVEKRFLSHMKMRFGSVIKAMVTSFIITLTNPATLFGVLAVVATFGGLQGKGDTTALIGGIFCGSSLWWLMLSGGVSLFRHHFTDKRIMKINRVTAIILSGIALWAVGIGSWHYISS